MSVDNDWQPVVIEYLATATPQQKHYFVLRTNYDDLEDSPIVASLIDDPSLDAATAQALFWLLGGGAHWFELGGESEDPEVLTLTTLRDRLITGFYRGSGLAFDPRDDEGHDWVAEYGPLPDDAAPQLVHPHPGTELGADDFDDYLDGLPVDVYDRL